MYGNIAQNYQNQAANYGQMYGQGLNALGQAAGQWSAYKSMNPYQSGGSNQTKYGPAF